MLVNLKSVYTSGTVVGGIDFIEDFIFSLSWIEVSIVNGAAALLWSFDDLV